jgi:hypothetical protein
MTYQQNRTMQQGRGNVRPQAGQSPAGNGLAGERAAIAALTALRNLQPEDLVSIAEKAGRFFLTAGSRQHRYGGSMNM